MKMTALLTESANNTNRKSKSREPLTQELFSGSNSQTNNRSNDSEDGRIRNSVDSRRKADVNIYDDKSFCWFEDTDMGGQTTSQQIQQQQ
jgi:hypothetical protein